LFYVIEPCGFRYISKRRKPSTMGNRGIGDILYFRKKKVKKGAHIDERSMRSLLIAGKGMRAARLHVENCAECRERYAKLKAVLAPSVAGDLTPPPEIEKRILASYRATYHDTAPRLSVRAFRGLLAGFNPMVMAGSLAVVLIVASAGFLIHKAYSPRPLPLYVYHIRGDALIDGKPASYRSTIYEGSLLEVPERSVLVLSLKNRFLLKVHENSELRIAKATMKRGRGQSEFIFNLRKGTLFTRINTPDNEPNYFYMTPNARIKSSRTEFILKVAGDKTILIPRSGTINITSLETEEEVLTLPDKKYVITSSIETTESAEYEDVSEQLSSDAENPLGENGRGEVSTPLGPMS